MHPNNKDEKQICFSLYEPRRKVQENIFYVTTSFLVPDKTGMMQITGKDPHRYGANLTYMLDTNLFTSRKAAEIYVAGQLAWLLQEAKRTDIGPQSTVLHIDVTDGTRVCRTTLDLTSRLIRRYIYSNEAQIRETVEQRHNCWISLVFAEINKHYFLFSESGAEVETMLELPAYSVSV